MANQEAAAKERLKIFGVAKTEGFTSPRTPHGDEIVMGLVGFPAAFGNQPFGAGEMKQGDNWLDAVFFTGTDNIPVMRKLRFIEMKN